MARSFTGTEYFSGGPTFQLGTTATIAAWVYFPSGGALDNLMGRRGNSSQGWGWTGSSNIASFTYYGVAVLAGDYAIPLANAWYHIMYAKTGAAELKLYVNGVLEDTISTGTYLDSGGQDMYVGAVNDGGAPFSARPIASIAELGLWSTALGLTEAQALYGSGATAGDAKSPDYYSSNLVHYWKFDEESGNAAATVGGVTLTAVNSPGTRTHPNIDYGASGGAMVMFNRPSMSGGMFDMNGRMSA